MGIRASPQSWARGRGRTLMARDLGDAKPRPACYRTARSPPQSGASERVSACAHASWCSCSLFTRQRLPLSPDGFRKTGYRHARAKWKSPVCLPSARRRFLRLRAGALGQIASLPGRTLLQKTSFFSSAPRPICARHLMGARRRVHRPREAMRKEATPRMSMRSTSAC